jgi:hypothetical protein
LRRRRDQKRCRHLLLMSERIFPHLLASAACSAPRTTSTP